MQRIKINNFGPIEYFDSNIAQLSVLFGPQASGKSTISKSVYFFKSLRDDFTKLLLDFLQSDAKGLSLTSYGKLIRKKFINFFGPTYHIDKFSLEFSYTKENILVISLKDKKKFVDPIFSDALRRELFDLINEVKNYKELRYKLNGTVTIFERIYLDSQAESFLKNLEKKINTIFGDDREILFIPAGRSLISTLSNKLSTIFKIKEFDEDVDYITKTFLEKIISTRELFTKSLKEIVDEQSLLTDNKIRYSRVNNATKLIYSILKGQYRYDNGKDKFILPNHRYVMLNYASSGQQESVWILYLLFLFILKNNNYFVVIEEPEAHLFPEAQRDIVLLIALFSNSNNNQTFVTTHSPYVLATLNNLLYAYEIGQTNEKVTEVVSNQFWINPSTSNVWFVSNGNCIDIIDDETKLISSDQLDSVSTINNKVFEDLFSLEGVGVHEHEHFSDLNS